MPPSRSITFFATTLTFFAAAQTTNVDPATLYSQVRTRVLADVDRLPNYGCVETITRRNYSPRSAPKASPEKACSILLSQPADKLVLVSLDRFRLDVAIGSQQEIFSWVGASRYDTAELKELLPGGQTASGEFSGFIASVLRAHETMAFSAPAERGLYRYNFDTPASKSQWEIRAGLSAAYAAYHGFLLLDPAAADLVRLSTQTAELSTFSGYCQVASNIEYTRLAIHGHEVLIPRQADYTSIDRDGIQHVNTNAYNKCHEFTGESVIKFDNVDSPAAEATTAATPAATVNIPQGLKFDARITTPIDSDTSAVGDSIEAALRSPLRDSAGRSLIPAGARLHGRITKFGFLNATPSFWTLGVRFQSVDVNGHAMPFAANIVSNREGTVGPLNGGGGRFVFLKDKRVQISQLDASWTTAPPHPTSER